jgi:hypothetical protein
MQNRPPTRATSQKHAARLPQRHTRRAPLEHRAGANPRARFTRAPPTCGRITRADRAAHADMRHVLGLEGAPAHCPATGGAQGQHRACAVGVRQKCVRCVRQHTCSRCMPTWISAPQVGRGSCDPLQPFWSCPRLTCGDGDPTEEELGS